MDNLLNILFEPNIVYLALVLGIVLMFFAVVMPGTGFIEGLSGAILIFAGIGVYLLADQVNYWALVLLVLGIIPFVLAVRHTSRLAYVVVSLLFITIGSAYLFRGDVWWLPRLNLPLVFLVSILNAVFLWIVVQKGLEASLSLPVQDLSRLIGQVGEAETDVHDQGTVQVASELWSARSQEPIPAGEMIRVTGRDGFILEVERVQPPA